MLKGENMFYLVLTNRKGMAVLRPKRRIIREHYSYYYVEFKKNKIKKIVTKTTSIVFVTNNKFILKRLIKKPYCRNIRLSFFLKRKFKKDFKVIGSPVSSQ